MNKKNKLSIIAVLAIIVVTVSGTTYAFFSGTASNSGDDVTGNSFDFGASISLNTIYRANNLVPLSNGLVSTAVSKANNKCIDKDGYDVCSLYQITLSNTGDTVVLYPFVTTISSTYTTDNLKCQLFNSSYTAVSDAITLSNTENDKVYITSGGNNVSVNLASSNQVYYLAIWIMDTLAPQPADYSKAFSGTITFEAGTGGQVRADFTA